jgi:hypothetical protein
MPEFGDPLRPRFQFSMFRLMVVVTLVALLLGLAVTFGGFINVLLISVVGCVLPTPLVVCAIFGGKDLRAFAIGALIPWFTQITLRFPAPASTAFLTIWLLAMGGVCGAVAIATRRWLERTGNGA